MVQQASRPAPGQGQEVAVCRHHWIIEAPTGPVSRGVCRLCDEVREFNNYIETAPWIEDAASVQPIGPDTIFSSSEDLEDFEEL